MQKKIWLLISRYLWSRGKESMKLLSFNLNVWKMLQLVIQIILKPRRVP